MYVGKGGREGVVRLGRGRSQRRDVSVYVGKGRMEGVVRLGRGRSQMRDVVTNEIKGAMTERNCDECFGELYWRQVEVIGAVMHLGMEGGNKRALVEWGMVCGGGEIRTREVVMGYVRKRCEEGGKRNGGWRLDETYQYKTVCTH